MQRVYPRSACRSRRLGAIIGAALLGLAAVGCPRGKSKVTAPPPRWAGVTLSVACPDGPARVLFKGPGDTWARQTGATLKVVAPSADGAPAADVWVLAAPDLPRWAAAGKLLPLSDKDWSNLLGPYHFHLLRWENTPYALPLLGDALLCVYRADLYRDPDARAAYQAKHQSPLNPPATWEELADQAAFFTARRGKPSLPGLPAVAEELDRLFYAVAAPYAVRSVPEDEFRHVRADDARASAALSFQYDAATGRPRIADAGFVDALKLLQRLEPYRSKRGDRAAALTGDRAVLGVVTLAELAALRGDLSEGRWGVVRVPGRKSAAGGPVNYVPYIGAGAWLGAVAKDSANADAALDLLTTLSGDGASLEVVHNPAYGGGPFRRSHLEDRVVGWFNYGLSQEQTTRLLELLRDYADPKIVNPAYALRIPAAREHWRALVEAIFPALVGREFRRGAGGEDAAAALAGAAKVWEGLDGDPAKARADYRRSVGMQP